MILRALFDYYHRLGSLPAPGLELKEIAYVIVIDRNGRFVRFENKRIDNKKCMSFLVAKGVVGRTSAPKSNILWDNGKYVFGMSDSDRKCFDLFVGIVNDIADHHPDDDSIQALRRHYSMPDEDRLSAYVSDENFDDVREHLSQNFTFQLEGDDRLIAEKSDLFRHLIGESGNQANEGICLITGERAPLVRLTTATALPGNSPGAALVGIQKKSGYDSYGKEQAYNAPISNDAEFAYTSALKHLLRKDSRNKVRVGVRTFLFWGNVDSDATRLLEDDFIGIMSGSLDNTENPDEKVWRITKTIKSIWSGEIKTTLNDRFYILGVAPNVGRIAVVYWLDAPLREFADNIILHIEDMELADNRPEDKRKPYSGVYSMIAAVTLGGKISDATPNLIEAVVKAVFSGCPYPFALYTEALARIRAELCDHGVTISRAAILKAYLNRKTKNSLHNKSLNYMLDKTNANIGYLCGRLAAVMEKIQDDAKSGDSIRTRYIGAASATPSAVFPAMLNLSLHHSEKLSEGSRIYYERHKQEILNLFPADGFPAHLDLNDQGRFFVGYYQQRVDLFTKHSEE